ncbi:hypothetical protein AAFF_G00322340 [Aldrovandia affinis]|uniref:Uncharacterized protein n=1 Tax=Aldrovandia affinis TaxID=143900 RepID=A0AAD7SN28_9TELE|nr:hypothetical protein AAFF_G00322340 [Aldrovandia affinis]
MHMHTWPPQCTGTHVGHALLRREDGTVAQTLHSWGQAQSPQTCRRGERGERTASASVGGNELERKEAVMEVTGRWGYQGTLKLFFSVYTPDPS